MRPYTYHLKAGVAVTKPVVGSFYRITEAESVVSVEIDQTGQIAKLQKGQAIKPDEEFTSLTLMSDVDQLVEVYVGYGMFFDDRLSGAVDHAGVLSIVNAGGSQYGEKITPLVNGTAVKVLDQNTDRVSVTFVADVDGYIWHDNTAAANKGIPYKANTIAQITNTAELWFMPSANGQAIGLEDLK